MMSLTFGLFTQVSGSGPLGPLVIRSYKKSHHILSSKADILNMFLSRKLLLTGHLHKENDSNLLIINGFCFN